MTKKPSIEIKNIKSRYSNDIASVYCYLTFTGVDTRVALSEAHKVAAKVLALQAKDKAPWCAPRVGEYESYRDIAKVYIDCELVDGSASDEIAKVRNLFERALHRKKR